MTPTRTKELEQYRNCEDRQAFEFEELKNILIEDCLEELKNNPEHQARFNHISNITYNKNVFHYNATNKKDYIVGELDIEDFLSDQYSPSYLRQIIIQTLLSRTLAGEAVMEFLDTPVQSFDLFQAHLQDCLTEFHLYNKVDKDIVNNAILAVFMDLSQMKS